MAENGPENDFGGTGVGWPSNIQSDGPEQFANAASDQLVNPVSIVLARAHEGPVSTAARDVNFAHQIYHNAVNAGEEPDSAIEYAVQAINSQYDGEYERPRSSYPWHKFSNEAMSVQVVAFEQ